MAALDQTDALVERLSQATVATLELACVHIGNRLGFYRALADGSEATPGELAHHTGTAERYVREWLEQQAVAGFLSVDDPGADAAERRYRMPAAHRPVFIEEESLAAIPAVDTRLRRPPAARVADLACGRAWSSIALARAYPEVTVYAIDADAESIADAHRAVAGAGLAHRVRPVVRDASDPELARRFDLVTIFEALHDMNHPIEALRAARGMLAEDGSVVIADERAAERFTAPGDELERSRYGWSVLHCLAVGMLEPTSAGTGAVIRPDTVRAYARAAGFEQVDVLPIEHEFWRFYRLVR